MRSVRQFTVIPAVPPALQALTEVARNLHWTWDRETQRLFQQLDPALWTRTGRDPLRLLAEITETRWATLSADQAVIDATNEAHRRLRDAIDCTCGGDPLLKTRPPSWHADATRMPQHCRGATADENAKLLDLQRLETWACKGADDS